MDISLQYWQILSILFSAGLCFLCFKTKNNKLRIVLVASAIIILFFSPIRRIQKGGEVFDYAVDTEQRILMERVVVEESTFEERQAKVSAQFKKERKEWRENENL